MANEDGAQRIYGKGTDISITARYTNTFQRLPEELICHIETYLKAEAHLHGLSELQNQEKSDRTDIYTISEFLESTV